MQFPRLFQGVLAIARASAGAIGAARIFTTRHEALKLTAA